MENEKWEVIEHSWSDTSIKNQDDEIICTLSIYGSACEEDQEEKEKTVSERFKLISKAPQMSEMLKTVSNSLLMTQNPNYELLISEIDNLIKEATEL